MADDKWKKGDVVMLKSGGARMTVDEVGDGYVGCTWFGEKNKLERAEFDPDILTSGTFRGMA